MDHPGCDSSGSEGRGDDRKESPAEEESEPAVTESRSGGGITMPMGGVKVRGGTSSPWRMLASRRGWLR